MPKYRKKPVAIEAEVYRPGLEDGFECQLPTCRIDDIGNCYECIHRHPYIDTLEGRHYISSGDYIITGVKGERYPCKPDVFEMLASRYRESRKERTWQCLIVIEDALLWNTNVKGFHLEEVLS